MNKDVFIQNEDELITNYLFNYIFNGETLEKYKISKFHMELIVSPECNQNCKYCYIAKFGKDLYPIKERVEKEITLKNLKILLSFLNDNKILIPVFHLFAGDMFFKDMIFFDIIQELYNYYNNIILQERNYFHNIINHFQIIVPTNFSFVENENILPKLLEWQEKFKKLKINLQFSASIDGKFLSENRENKKEDEVDLYYQKIFKAIKELNAGIHPMVSAFKIEKWIDNYKWLMEQLEKYNILDPFASNYPMLLEVRDDNWDNDSIKYYLDFLNYLIMDRLQMCNNSIEELTYHLFCGDGKNNTLQKPKNYDPIELYFKDRNEDNSSCDFSDVFCITLNNLKFVPCHRLSYSHLAGGQFVIDDNKITKIKAINPSGFIGLQLNSPQMHSSCLECPIYHFCIKGCYGSQYETHGEPLMLNQTVCELFKQKNKFLITKYKEIGVIDCLFNMENIPIRFKQEIYKLCELYELI